MTYFPATVRPGGKSNRLTLLGRYMGRIVSIGNSQCHKSQLTKMLKFGTCKLAVVAGFFASCDVASCEFASIYNDPRQVRRCTIRRHMDFLKTMTGKVVSGLVAWRSLPPGSRGGRWIRQPAECCLTGTGKIVSWMGIVLIVPWATFFVIGRVAKFDNNLAGSDLVGGVYPDRGAGAGLAFRLAHPSRHRLDFFILGGLFAAVYNLFTCDWIAEKV